MRWLNWREITSVARHRGLDAHGLRDVVEHVTGLTMPTPYAVPKLTNDEIREVWEYLIGMEIDSEAAD